MIYYILVIFQSTLCVQQKYSFWSRTANFGRQFSELVQFVCRPPSHRPSVSPSTKVLKWFVIFTVHRELENFDGNQVWVKSKALTGATHTVGGDEFMNSCCAYMQHVGSSVMLRVVVWSITEIFKLKYAIVHRFATSLSLSRYLYYTQHPCILLVRSDEPMQGILRFKRDVLGINDIFANLIG